MGKELLSFRLGMCEPTTSSRRLPLRGFLYLVTLLCLVSLYYLNSLHMPLGKFLRGPAKERYSQFFSEKVVRGWCPLPDVVVPHDDGLKPSHHLMSLEQRSLQIERLTSAVRIPTESYDDNGGVDEDPRWATFGDFHDVLQRLFPLVYVNLRKLSTSQLILGFTNKNNIGTHNRNSERSIDMACYTH